MLIEGLPLWLAQTNCWLVAPDGPGGECVLIDAPPDPAIVVALEKIPDHASPLMFSVRFADEDKMLLRQSRFITQTVF